MVKTKRKKKSQNKTRKIKKLNKAPSSPGLFTSLKNFALIIPEEGVNLALESYMKFMSPFLGAVTKQLKKIPHSPKTVSLAMKRVMKSPKFKKAWFKTVTDIFNVLIRPVMTQIAITLEKEGIFIAKAMSKVIGRFTLRGAQAAAEALEAALSSIPGVGTVLDALQVAQAGFDAIATLSIQSIKIMTQILTSFMTITGDMIGPVASVLGTVKNLFSTITEVTSSITHHKKKNDNKINKIYE